MRIDQVLPSLASRDAIGAHSLALAAALRAAGIDSDIYYGSCTPDIAGAGRPITELGRNARRDDGSSTTPSIGSPVYDILNTRTEPKLVNYHNITPAELIGEWAPQVAHEAALGRAQLVRLAEASRFAVADSAFNEAELVADGYQGTAVVPLIIDMTSTGQQPDKETARRLAHAKEGGGGRLPLRGKDLALEGPARPGQDAGRLPTALRPQGAPPPGGHAASATATAPPSSPSSTSSS